MNETPKAPILNKGICKGNQNKLKSPSKAFKTPKKGNNSQKIQKYQCSAKSSSSNPLI